MGFVTIVQILHRDVQPGTVYSSNQIISRDRHGIKDLSPHKIPNLFYYIKILDWDGHRMVDMSCCSKYVTVQWAV